MYLLHSEQGLSSAPRCRILHSSLFTLRSSFSWCKDTTSAQGHLSKCVVECRSFMQPNKALLCTLTKRFISTYKSASLAPIKALHESSLKHIFNRACWFAQKFLNKFHLTDGENLLAVEVSALSVQEFIQFHAAFDFAGQTAHSIRRFAVGEIHHRQDTASISCF